MASLLDSLTTRNFFSKPIISRISSPSSSFASSSSSNISPFSPPSVLSYSHKRSHHSRLPYPVAATLDGPSVEEDELEFEESEEDSYPDESDEEEDISIDISILEKEARDIARDYATTLSRELKLEDDVVEGKESRRKGKRQAKNNQAQILEHLLQRVAIVGRPNVGKSALFNRLVGENKAIVVDEPGVTRDRLYGRSYWGDQEFVVVDTGGVMTVSKSPAGVMEELNVSTTIGMEGIPLSSREAAVARMPSMIEKQATAAVEESDVIVFVVDGQTGPTGADVEIADWLRKYYSHKNIILAVNKCESPRKGLMQASEFWSLGFSPIPISALSGTGTGELLDLVCSGLNKLEIMETMEEEEEENYIPAIAIIGRPNVGKSSILNALVREDRTIVSPVSGTTRDAIDAEFTGPDGEKFRLIDTAGIRKKAAVASSGSTTEAMSVNRAFRAIRRSDVVALVIEAMACITEQDMKIAERIEREGKGCLVVVNKWDTIPNKNQQTAAHYEDDVREKLRSLKWAPIVYSTAITGHSVDNIVVAAATVQKERSRRLSTATLNQVIREAVAFKSPPRTRGGKRGRVYYCTQAAIRPPTFVFFVNDAKLFSDTYRRYMEKQLRTDAGFAGTPIRLLWRSRKRSDKNGGGGGTMRMSSLSRERNLATKRS
ncbi:PREDICTED: GTPase Der isoform X1 [Brassica oleracea var. oleracea]|uniref:GTPase Der n=1 Tax=Brassica oleracea var. oleracea TaxID=109376 RepID=A0A0D3CKZ0_BRAOL|nr:PREDICTED: GTPase Der isoform X1 [Brassica oleracea var. oleracea]